MLDGSEVSESILESEDPRFVELLNDYDITSIGQRDGALWAYVRPGVEVRLFNWKC